MKILTTTSLQIAIAVALTGGLAACNDKPVPTVTNAPAEAPAQPAANPPVDASAAPAPLRDATPPSPGLPPTARELAAAPRSAALQEGAAGAVSAADASASGMPAAEGRVAAPAASAANTAAASPRYANVISVQPVKRKVDHKREECRDERVVHKARPKDDHQIAGTVIGAIAGGVIGNQVGGGRGRDIATVAGAVGGGYAGKKIQQGQQNRNTYTTTERRCRTVNEPTEEVVAYDVVYEYLGATQKVRLDHDPGDRVQLPVRGIE